MRSHKRAIEMVKQTYADLLTTTTLSSYSEEEQINIIGNLFDWSMDRNSIEGLEHGFNLSRQIDLKTISEEGFTVLNYDLANGWSYLRQLKYQNTKDDWNFQMQEISEEILHLRRAIASPGFTKVIRERQCQMYTNLGNLFSYIGRFIEAQEYWNKALTILPNFSMAIGNKGHGLFHYGLALFEPNHQDIFSIYSFHYLRSALALKQYLHPNAAIGMQQMYDHLEKYIPEEFFAEPPSLDNYDLGDDEELRNYRRWALENLLFVNPLNDLGAYTATSHDCLNLPTLYFKTNRPPVYLNLFNQMKQEFATARFCFYTAISGSKPHFSDVDTTLVETMECVRYSYFLEQLKISFRLAYSILDKVAYCLNDYLDLRIPSSKVSFRTIWYSDPKKRQLHSFFSDSDNWPLRGLFWLSKDLYEKDNDFEQVVELDAREIASIRNYLEHKGFKILPELQLFPGIFDEEDVSFAITRSSFEKKALKLLKLARASIMYLSLSISHEEKKKDYSGIKAFTVPSTSIPHYMKF